MAILSIDFGEKRVGLAISWEEIIAKRYTTLTYKTDDELVDKILTICNEEEIDKIIVGLPVTLNERKVGHQAEKVREFTDSLQKEIRKPIILVDETLTTEEAKENLKEEGLSEDKIKPLIDQEAARIILQDYLNSDQHSIG